MSPELRPWHRYATTANVLAQTGIIITGAIVRVTASGLGCPTWPECVDGSLIPTSTQTQEWHKYVEFGNRLLTTVLIIAAGLTLIAIVQHNRLRQSHGLARRPAYFRLALACFAGIFVQAILGGITVLTGLNPLTVAAHFLVSILLVACSYRLWWLIRVPNSDEQHIEIHPTIMRGLWIQTALAAIVIVLGTLVTGSGPHAGDSANIARLPFDPRIITWIHADAVLLFIGLSCGLVVALVVNNAHTEVRRRAWLVVCVALGQGAIGYVQYFTNVPWVLVAFHVAGACALWLATLTLLFSPDQRTNGSIPTARNSSAK